MHILRPRSLFREPIGKLQMWGLQCNEDSWMWGLQCNEDSWTWGLQCNEDS
jgi:hypothetical protein